MPPGQEPPSEILRDRVSFDETGQQALAEKFHDRVSVPGLERAKGKFMAGWVVSAVNDRHLTIKTVEMALKRRGPDTGLLHHSDQGCTYASADYQAILSARGTLQHEPEGQLLRQRRHGELLLHAHERARGALRELRRGKDGLVRLYRGVL